MKSHVGRQGLSLDILGVIATRIVIGPESSMWYDIVGRYHVLSLCREQESKAFSTPVSVHLSIFPYDL